jgi:hypothetical protein
MQSSPTRILLHPGPWIWIAGLFAYCCVVALSPKMSARTAALEDLARPFVISWVEPERLGRYASGDEGLDQAEWRPRFITDRA